MNNIHLLLLAGSTRSDSWNKKLIKLAHDQLYALYAQKISTTLIDLKDYPLPFYDGDLENRQGIPDNALKLKKLFLAHQGLVIASPEYNGGISAVLKNSIDWVSRPDIPKTTNDYFAGKIALLLSASTGKLGGLRGLDQLRAILTKLKVLVLPEQLNIGPADKKFTSAGTLSDKQDQERLTGLLKKYSTIITRLN